MECLKGAHLIPVFLQKFLSIFLLNSCLVDICCPQISPERKVTSDLFPEHVGKSPCLRCCSLAYSRVAEHARCPNYAVLLIYLYFTHAY